MLITITSFHSQVCFAYRGSPSRLRVRLVNPSVNVRVADSVMLPPVLSWRYVCVDMFQALRERRDVNATSFTANRIRFDSTNSDFWVDELAITTAVPTGKCC